MAREPLPAEVRVGEPTRLEQHAPGAVEHEDPLLGLLPDLSRNIARCRRHSRPPSGAFRERRTGSASSLGVCNPVAELPFEALRNANVSADVVPGTSSRQPATTTVSARRSASSAAIALRRNFERRRVPMDRRPAPTTSVPDLLTCARRPRAGSRRAGSAARPASGLRSTRRARSPRALSARPRAVRALSLVDLVRLHGRVDQCDRAVLQHLEEPGPVANSSTSLSLEVHTGRARLQRRDQRCVAREHADLAGGAGTMIISHHLRRRRRRA